METFYIQIPTDKKDFFLSLMKELDFVKISDGRSEFHDSDQDYIQAILQSENEIANGSTITHAELKKEVKTWLA